jgi:hypothetical protein
MNVSWFLGAWLILKRQQCLFNKKLFSLGDNVALSGPSKALQRPLAYETNRLFAKNCTFNGPCLSLRSMRFQESNYFMAIKLVESSMVQDLWKSSLSHLKIIKKVGIFRSVDTYKNKGDCEIKSHPWEGYSSKGAAWKTAVQANLPKLNLTQA